jgi:hypothetical protein
VTWLVGRTVSGEGVSLLSPSRNVEMVEWVRRLGVDPASISTRVALAKTTGGRYELHLSEFVRHETTGRILLDYAADMPVTRPVVLEVEPDSWPAWLLGLGVPEG